jgi:hypothetical protein
MIFIPVIRTGAPTWKTTMKGHGPPALPLKNADIVVERVVYGIIHYANEAKKRP